MLAIASREARGVGSPHVSSEHFLLAAVAYGQGVGAAVLANAGLQPERLRAHLATVGYTQEEVLSGYGFSTRPVFIAAVHEAESLGHTEIEPEHIILGLLGERAGGAASVFGSFGVNVAVTRQAIITRISNGPDNRPAA